MIKKARIIIDTDPGVDDTMAIYFGNSRKNRNSCCERVVDLLFAQLE